VIRTERLDLLTLDLAIHRALTAGRLDEVASALGAAVPPDFPNGVPSVLRIEQLTKDPAELPWLVRAVVLRAERRAVGSAGFHAPPQDGLAELGYEILAADRRHGYAREAVTGLMDWARGTGRVTTFRASIAPGNAPSQSLVTALGFARVGEQIDPVDGLEWVFERPA
jgi:[ribosomal protein S5]-alanine N-acetyltransferase